jgi:hypothetical protein
MAAWSAEVCSPVARNGERGGGRWWLEVAAGVAGLAGGGRLGGGEALGAWGWWPVRLRWFAGC